MNKKESNSNPKRLVIIPARGGPKRIPGKNLVDVCGSLIIWYPIETALASSLFHEVLVSTDDAKILDFAIKLETLQLAKGQKSYLETIQQSFRP